MRLLVTGCAGFIGYHLCERLLDDGHEVVGVDDLSTGQMANVEDLRTQPRFQFVEHDIVRPLNLEKPFQTVYNLACPASPIDFGPRRLDILAVCSRGVWNVLDFCRQTGARLLHTSSSEVYGDSQEHPQRESYWGHVNPIGPRSCYDEGKRFAEALITNYVNTHRIAAHLARVFNTYGPRMRPDDGRALPNFITQAFAGKPLTVHGDGSQTRSFCYVTDMVDGLIRLANSDVAGPVNLGNPAEISILEFAREIVRLTGGKSEITHVGRPTDDPSLRRPDITRARQQLGWEPEVDRTDGLARTVEWFRQNASHSP
ncbi:MAG: SDR family oxidoreductase [Planctomycetes bacterium]|nr:SDR family oxidoreductase [Planctomycetota bacterium]